MADRRLDGRGDHCRGKDDEEAIGRIAAEVRELLAGFPMPGWAAS